MPIQCRPAAGSRHCPGLFVALLASLVTTPVLAEEQVAPGRAADAITRSSGDDGGVAGGGTCPGSLSPNNPLNGVVDARQPIAPGGGPALGLGSAAEPIVVNLGAVGASATGFNVCVSNGSQNPVTMLTDHGNGTYSLVLTTPLTANTATRISYGGGGSICLISHPGNVDANSAANAVDVLRVVDAINGVFVPPFGLYSADADRSGQILPPDILRVVDLLNGAGQLPTQLGTLRPACPACEGGTCSGNYCLDEGLAAECCEVICSADPFCCDVEFDSICEQEISLCSEGDLCLAEGITPGCCEILCAADPFCCFTEFDDLCEEQLNLCGEVDACLDAGVDSVCCEAICEFEPTCCDLSFDEICGKQLGICEDINRCLVAGVMESCCDVICEVDPSCCNWKFDDACEAKLPLCDTGNPCLNAGVTLACCDVVCTFDPFCCEVEFDSFCQDELSLCDFEDACLGAGIDAGCCDILCAEDPFCCNVEFDEICAGQLELCDAQPSDCCSSHAGPGCDDATCEQAVCALNPLCCQLNWNLICVVAAGVLCADLCE